MSSNYITRVDGWYRYRRRIPKEVSHLDHRKEVKISLRTKDPKIAQIRGSIYNEQIESFWKSLIHSNEKCQFDQKYQAAVQLAKAHGFAYKTAEQVAASALDEIIERLSLINSSAPEAFERPRIDALLGGLDKPKILLASCWDIFEDSIHDRVADKSKDQIRKWKNVRRAAITNFMNVCSIQNLNDVDRGQILKFVDWWNSRIKDGYKAKTANKQISCLRDVLETVSIKKEVELDIASLFAQTSFKEIVVSRPPFEADFIQNKLLSKVCELGDRYSYAFWAIADSGMRQSELYGLAPEDIFLNDEIPYIWIRPRKGYSLKTPHSERKIPLVGTALKAFEKFPLGFQGQGTPELFSQAVNKFLKTNQLNPTPEHTAYSLRHTFKDRLRDYRDTGAPEEIIDELMGHRKPSINYGRGHKLETKYKVLKEIEFKTEGI